MIRIQDGCVIRKFINYQINKLTVSPFILMKIKINGFSDPQLAENFPVDPFSNICITTAQQQLHLQKAFLSMDSQYFSQLNQDITDIDLSFMPYQPLSKVLHSLYGCQLQAQSAGELVSLFPIIAYLGIQQYRKTIQIEILNRQELLENLQILQLGFRYKFCQQALIDHHLTHKLAALENNKNYLQIGKISNECFNQITRLFLQQEGEQAGKVLNNVMENYFNRKNIKALSYLTENKQKKLLSIWMNYHHVNKYELSSEPTTNIPSLSSLQHTHPHKITIKQNILQQLILANQERDYQINQLLQQIQTLKSKIGISSEIVTTKSIFINSYGGEVSAEQRLKFGQISKKDRPSQLQSLFYSRSAKLLFKRSVSGSPSRVIFNRMGAKNMKRWL